MFYKTVLNEAYYYSDVTISQRSVVTCLRGGEIFNNSFIANFLEAVPVKEFFKSFNLIQFF